MKTFLTRVDLMSEHDLNLTNDVFAAVDLYITLRELINSEFEPHQLKNVLLKT